MKKTALLLFASILPLIAVEKPNIIFILFDDMGYGQPKSYREVSEFKTPNIDRIAKEGMRFTDAHSPSSVCTPTRYGLLTGRYPSRIGQFGVLTTFSKPIISESRMTVASLLKDNGYDTACIGKWHLGMEWKGKPGNESIVPVGSTLNKSPNSNGFDYFVGYTHARNIGTVIEQDKVVMNIKEVENQPLMSKKMLDYLSDPARKQKPFFLYLPLCPPHTPVAPATEFIGKSGIKGKESLYGDWVYQGDHMLGQVLDVLARQQLAANTLIIVSADNGAAGRPYAPLRDAKTSIYEGGHRIPFLARWPGKIKAGSVCDETICLTDFMATSAEIVGAKLPDNAAEDSVSLLPHLLGNASPTLREATVHQDYRGNLAIRQGPWKLIFSKSGKRELYNLRTDLSETQDVLAANPEIAEKMTTLMQNYIDKGRSTPGVAQKNDYPLSIDSTAKKPKKNGKKAKDVSRNDSKGNLESVDIGSADGTRFVCKEFGQTFQPVVRTKAGLLIIWEKPLPNTEKNAINMQ
jgi:arylsulfatase A-like enzyme